MRNKEELWAAKEKYVREIAEINKANNFSHDCRPPIDEIKSAYCWQKIQELNDAYDKLHPLDPCSECGQKRKAHLSAQCMNIGSCSKAPSAIGG